MNILITGGAGFIGSNLAAYFMRQGHTVTLFDNFSRRGSEANLAWLQSEFPAGPEVVRGDVRDAEAIKAARASRPRLRVFALEPMNRAPSPVRALTTCGTPASQAATEPWITGFSAT